MKKIFAEFIGTFTLVLFACGTASVLSCSKVGVNTAYIATALAFGLVIVAMAYSIGQVSGCHINPAVSLAVLMCGKMSLSDFFGYVIAQFAGALSGAATLALILGDKRALGQNSLYKDDILISLIVEIILTFIFVLVILSVTSRKEYAKPAGLVIGLTLTLVHIFGIHFTGTSVNPARSFGPAIIANGDALSCLWVFIVAPLVGAALAALVYRFLIKESAEAEA